MCPHRRRISGLGILRSAGRLAPVAFAKNKHIHRHKYLWKDTTQLYVKIYKYSLKNTYNDYQESCYQNTSICFENREKFFLLIKTIEFECVGMHVFDRG